MRIYDVETQDKRIVAELYELARALAKLGKESSDENQAPYAAGSPGKSRQSPGRARKEMEGKMSMN